MSLRLPPRAREFAARRQRRRLTVPNLAELEAALHDPSYPVHWHCKRSTPTGEESEVEGMTMKELVAWYDDISRRLPRCAVSKHHLLYVHRRTRPKCGRCRALRAEHIDPSRKPGHSSPPQCVQCTFPPPHNNTECQPSSMSSQEFATCQRRYRYALIVSTV